MYQVHIGPNGTERKLNRKITNHECDAEEIKIEKYTPNNKKGVKQN